MDRARLHRFVIGDFSWRRLARSIAIIYVLFAAFAWFASERLMFHPEASGNRQTEGRIRFASADGTVIAAEHHAAEGARYTLLFSHGNGEDMGSLRSLYRRLNALGFSVFAWDYRGYGASEGTPTEANTYEDIDAAYAYLTDTLRVPPDRIVAYGRSIGGGPSTDLAAHRPLGGLILESTYVTIFRVRTVIALLPFDRFRNIDKIARVNCPVLVMHGTDDWLIPVWHGERLFERAHEPKQALWLDGVGHADVPYADRSRYDAALTAFAALMDATASR